MAERTPHQAIEAYVRPIRRAIACLTPAYLNAPDGFRHLDEPVALLLNSGNPVPLRGPQRVQLRVRLRFRVSQLDPPRGLWEAQTAAYEYRLSDQDDREIVAYHWHPEGRSHARTPHLHLGPGAEVGRAALLTARLPTGSVPVHDVLRLAVEGFDVQPARRDWDRVLQVTAAT